MTKRFLSLFVLTLLAFAMIAMAAEASQVKEEMARKLRTNRVDAQDPAIPEVTSSKGNVGSSALGAYSPDGGSPGAIIGRTYRDRPNWYDGYRMVDWRHSASIHFMFMAQPVPGDDEVTFGRWPHYNNFDASVSPNGVWISGAAGVPMVANPFTKTGLEPQMDVDDLGRMVGVAHTYIPVAPEATGNQRTAEVYWDVGLATFIGDTVPQSISRNPEGSVAYPNMCFQEFGGTMVTHVLATEFSTTTSNERANTYWRREGGNGTYQGWTTPIQIVDAGGGNAKIAASRVSPEVGIVYLGETFITGDGHTQADSIIASQPKVLFSADYGVTWAGGPNPVGAGLINYVVGENNWESWVDVTCAYDTDGYFHVVYNTMEWDGETLEGSGAINPTRIMHWTNRVAGPNAGGTMGVVASVGLDFQRMCGRGWSNETNVARQNISECNDRLYVIWQQFGDTDTDDTLDCADSEVIGFTGSSNSEIYMSVSLSKDGSLWDRRRNLTNSQTPGCDGEVGNECDSDTYPAMARYGMNTSTMGATYWGTVPEAFQVRDIIAPAWSDTGNYLDVSYLDDAFPGNTFWNDPVVWTLSPLKWFRLPCVPPIIQPSINVLGTPFLYPANWIKSGDFAEVDLSVENLGNAALNVSSITVTAIDAPGGAISVSTGSMNVPPAGTTDLSITINPGGFINPGAGTAVAIHATVDFASDDPNRPLVTYLVNTVVTDSVVQIAWDTIATSTGYGLVLSNHGNGGHSGAGSVNLDFIATGEDCTIAADPEDTLYYNEDVYMYSQTPLVMQAIDNYSWNPFYSTFSPQTYNFQPVPGHAEMESNDNQFTTGTFVSSDSAIGMIKTWMVPKDGAANAGTGFVVEQWKLYSFDGGTHAGVELGQWMDWDVPSDTGSNNFGGVEQADDYVWLTGREYAPGDPETCIDSDVRFAASGMLGYYTSSEYAGNNLVNNTGMAGGYVHSDDDVFIDGGSILIVDSVWGWLTKDEFSANNAVPGDQQAMLAYGGFDITTDTLVIYTVHATMYDGSEAALADLINEAKIWYMDNRAGFGTFSCCGTYTSGFPGNANFGADGKRNLADITVLIDHVYISKTDLPCMLNGDVNFDEKNNLADITKLIDHVYISKAEFGPCQ